MATTYYGIYLGTSTSQLDPTEGNSNNEGYAAFQNTTWGSSTAPLSANKVSITAGNFTGGADAASLETNNNVENATLSTNIGGTAYTLTYDGTAIYNATLNYADGTTATVTAVLVQTTDGRLFLMPESLAVSDGDTARYEAKPITSIVFGTATTFNNVNFGSDRTVTAFDDGFVDGTAGNDLINGSYTEQVANGSDRVDNSDGTSAANTNGDNIRAGAGNDTVFAALGNDTVSGGDGNDQLYGGVGDDTLQGDAGDDTLYGEDGNDSLGGDAGNDSLFGGIGNDSLYGGADNDVLAGDAGNDQLYGGDGNDVLSGGADSNLLFGGNGSDTFIGGLGNDTIDGGAGQDYVDYSASGAGVNVNLATNIVSGGDAGGDSLAGGVDGIIGSAFNDTLTGADGESTVVGDAYTSVIFGGAGNDLIDGRAGGDSLYGGNDNDTIYGSAGNDYVSGDAGNDSLFGGADNDQLLGGAGNDTLDGGVGNDVLQGGDGDDTFQLTGTFGNDTITGGEAGETNGDILDASAITANTTLNLTGAEAGTITDGTSTTSFTEVERFQLGSGNDTVTGGAGNDSVDGGAGNDSMSGGAGNDTLAGGLGTDALFGGIGNDQLFGGAGNDTLDGGVGNDVLQGGDGDDTFQLTGTFGNDTITGGEAGETNGDILDASAITANTTLNLTGAEAGTITDGTSTTSFTEVERFQLGSGNDTVTGGAGNDSVDGGAGNDSMSGGAGNDTLAGGLGTDALFGGIGNDQLFGGAGNDTLDGGVGNDVLQGGDGDDTFQLTGTFGNDTITGGEAGETNGDILDASAITANTTLNLTGAEAGTITDGTSTTSFTEVERFQLGSGNDTVTGGAGNDSVDGGAGNDSMSGGAGNDTLAGGLGTDALFGGIGTDQLFGGAGNDTLDGGVGADSLYGGDGQDTFFVTAGDVVDGGADYDVIDLSGYGFRNTNIIYDPMNPQSGTVQFLDGTGAVTGSMNFSNIEKVIACFTPGTMVLTDHGKIAVEDLRIGDRILTRDNSFQPIRWVGRRDLSAAELAVSPQFNPVQIAAGALGAGLPERDMRVSPQHRMLISNARAELFFGEHEVLVAATNLVGTPGITRVKPGQVSYIHFMFDIHQVICADGAWSESFQPGAHSLAGLHAAQRDEVLALFPELTDGGRYPAARMTLKAKEARILMAA
ncbi:hypothetical protein GCM10010873_27760 [Cypionkella aquatica]|uniref:Hedgehog/Intein (Hint) domain-containing protein n=1 Tax=Cypionkella aquatica TaxID=1756042 RepID=A0AA37TUF9_9RHOB|nr:Hint domain-containing protein [Cypionkella aquatica]GLS87802.1 hypothetical protein GCM10010873_27760 [Cypionkella aquatica]